MHCAQRQRYGDRPGALAHRSRLRRRPEFLAKPAAVAGRGHHALRDDRSIRGLPDVEHPRVTTNEKWECYAPSRTRASHVHRQMPLAPGMEMELLRSQIDRTVAEDLPRRARRAGGGVEIVRTDSVVHLPSHRVALKRDEEEVAARAEALIAAGGLRLGSQQSNEPGSPVRLQTILQQLEREGRARRSPRVSTSRVSRSTGAPAAACACDGTRRDRRRHLRDCSAPAASSASRCSTISTARVHAARR